MFSNVLRVVLLPVAIVLLIGCQATPAAEIALPLITRTAEPQASPTATATMTTPPTPTATLTSTATPSPTPTETATQTPTHTPTATFTPTATPIPVCTQRYPAEDDLLPLVNRNYAIARDFRPSNLAALSEHFPVTVTLGYPTMLRADIIPPLKQLVDDMLALDLEPTILSGYRSYAEQAAAWQKWNNEYPEHAHIISTPPGTSEHQLGTTVDFGSPEMDNEFHTNFYKTSEGTWLLENAYRYGFTLSYPPNKLEETGFFFEPWHYRYVGVELATMLHESELSLTEYLLQIQGLPCVVEDQ